MQVAQEKPETCPTCRTGRLIPAVTVEVAGEIVTRVRGATCNACGVAFTPACLAVSRQIEERQLHVEKMKPAWAKGVL